MRSGSVFVPRSTSHESNGLRIAPSAFCTNFSHSMSSSRTAMTMPPTLSLWPLRYLVVLGLTDLKAAAELAHHHQARLVAVRQLRRGFQIRQPHDRIGR